MFMNSIDSPNVCCVLVAALLLAASSQSQEPKDCQSLPPGKAEGVRKSATSLRVEVSAAGRPVQGADVYVKDRSGNQHDQVTNPQGNALIQGLPRGSAALQVTAPGWTTYANKLELSQDCQTLKVELSK